MALLWRRDASGWTPTALPSPACGLGCGDDSTAPTLLRADAGSPDATWLLLTPPTAPVAVNGHPSHAGLVALRDRDEIRLADGTRLFFSTQEIATVEPFTATSTNLRCPRCRRPFVATDLIVRCPGPGCGVIHHQTDDLPCWTYTDRCAVCPRSTALDAEQRWTPEGL
jgi:hypothetical protein